MPNGKPTGYITYDRDDQIDIGTDWLVFLDLGAADGIYPGTFATVFRDNPVKGMPRLVMGEVGVLTVDETLLDGHHHAFLGTSCGRRSDRSQVDRPRIELFKGPRTRGPLLSSANASPNGFLMMTIAPSWRQPWLRPRRPQLAARSRSAPSSYARWRDHRPRRQSSQEELTIQRPTPRSSPFARRAGRSATGVSRTAPSTSPSNPVPCAPQPVEQARLQLVIWGADDPNGRRLRLCDRSGRRSATRSATGPPRRSRGGQVSRAAPRSFFAKQRQSS